MGSIGMSRRGQVSNSTATHACLTLPSFGLFCEPFGCGWRFGQSLISNHFTTTRTLWATSRGYQELGQQYTQMGKAKAAPRKEGGGSKPSRDPKIVITGVMQPRGDTHCFGPTMTGCWETCPDEC